MFALQIISIGLFAGVLSYVRYFSCTGEKVLGLVWKKYKYNLWKWQLFFCRESDFARLGNHGRQGSGLRIEQLLGLVGGADMGAAGRLPESPDSPSKK
ncbi:hypothetical protein [uncultured Desulfobacter sp.]|uniref:hypothetical protein n=1 Tax=uncultured Desulfobacter sp. TaxID=240139 RepID=UPI002AAB18EB|nr:hypothetical protein [uncultured Desulfobacter sp.]